MTLTWSRTRTLVAGVALIALTNAVALGGVAWNRSGAPESELKLSQREMHEGYTSRYDWEAAGSVMTLRWRVYSSEFDDLYYYYEGSYGGRVDWLDEAKLAALGFDVSKQPDPLRESRRRARILPKEALIVLELDGPAAQKALQRARERAASEAAKAAAEQDKAKPEQKNRARMAAESLKREETSNTRLFAVDAGLDAAALRAKYPDRSRYAIVRGKIRAWPPAEAGREKDRRWRGYVESLDSPRVNLPLEFRRQAGLALRGVSPVGPTEQGLRYEVTVAFGNRLEPWVTAVSVLK
jgi:uncharacterized protein DUF4824